MISRHRDLRMGRRANRSESYICSLRFSYDRHEISGWAVNGLIANLHGLARGPL